VNENVSLLHPVTMSVLTGAAAFFSCLVFSALMRVDARMPGLRWWTTASLIAVVGLLTLPMALHSAPAHRSWLFFANNALSLAALLFNLEGALEYRLRPPGTRWVWWIMLGGVVLALLFLWSSEDAPRQILFGVVSGVLLLCTAAALLWRCEASERFANTIASSVCVVMAAAVLIRSGARLMGVESFSSQLAWPQTMVYVAALVYMFGWTLGVSIMCFQRTYLRSQRVAREDSDSGLLNQVGFAQRLDHECARCSRGAPGFALIHLDIANFEDLRRTHGAAFANALANGLGRHLRSTVRIVDACARLDKARFGLLVIVVRTQVEIDTICARVVARLDGPFSTHGTTADVKLRFASALHGFDGTDAATLNMRLASRAP